MANKEQVKLLKASVTGWNKWREKEPGALIDLSEANLSQAFLEEVNLSFANLRQANLSRVNLRRANLSYAHLEKANLSFANLSGANLRGAKISEADLTDAKISEANLSEASLNGAHLSGADLCKASLIGASLIGAYLYKASLNGADLSGADLDRAYLRYADLSEAILYKASVSEAILSEADLSKAILSGADLRYANLSRAHLEQAVLSEADLSNSIWIETNIEGAQISKSNVYGVNVWDLEGEFKEQKDLIITPKSQSSITVDNIKVAQFIYLILNNKEIRDVINTLTSKTVLILGRFAIPERKAILDTLRDKLREYDLLPIVFDFDRPTDKDFTETIKTLTGISYFVIADVTNPKSSPLELQATIPDYQIPFVPIIQEGEYPFAMMVDLQKKYNWVLDTISYDSLDTLIEILKPHIIDPAIKKRDELRLIKAKEPTIISGRELKDKGKP
jgi:uncharacterized protein YjbI with pentapeptide repeats